MLFGFGRLSRPRIEISDISADISAIYRISDRNFGEISVSRTHAHVADFLLQNIENISEISVKYRRYIVNIGIYR